VLGKEVVDQALADPETAPLDDRVKATLRLLRKVTKEHAAVTADDMRAVLATGVDRRQIEDALYVGFCFNIIDRLADTFEFWVGPPETFEMSAKMLLKRGYEL
jgi:alkylhydroperoxidase family enzyme